MAIPRPGLIHAACACMMAAHIACTASVSDQELIRRTAAAQPAWEDYPEDIKGMIGAAPVAEWQGVLTKVVCAKNEIQVTFALTGPWAQRTAAIPILLRDPLGQVSRNQNAVPTGAGVVYSFARPNPADGPFPAWLELKFPHGQKRIVLTERGDWCDKDVAAQPEGQ